MMDFFAKALIKWFETNGRKDLPWQQHGSAYHVYISEIMLQQTQVKTVISYFQKFIARFPTITKLANANIDEVLSLWTGLGYYARARNLHKTAKIIATEYKGEFPQTLEQLMALPGVGRSTAAAILSLAFHQPATILDGNVKRVLARFHAIKGWPQQKLVEQKLWALATSHTPSSNNAAYTQAIMDLGATICTPKQPLCSKCPVRSKCKAHHLKKELAFPEKKPKKPLPTKQVQFVLIENHRSEVLLEKRPPIGIWGGLWSFPECEIEQNLKEWCHSHLGLQVNHIRSLPLMKHSFSHYHLEIHPKLIRLKKAQDVSSVSESLPYQWHSKPQSLELGLATPVKHLLSYLQSEKPK